MYTVGGIVIAIIMIGSIFLIYNSFSISLNERTRQIGILSSVGATAKQLRASVLFEGLCIGAVGIPPVSYTYLKTLYKTPELPFQAIPAPNILNRYSPTYRFSPASCRLILDVD